MSNKYLFLKSKSINSNFIVGYDGRIWEMPAQGGTAVADLQGHPLPNTQQIKHLRRPKVRIMDGRAHYKKYKLHQWHPLPLLFSTSGYPQIYDELYPTINTLYLNYSLLQAAPDLRRALPHHQHPLPLLFYTSGCPRSTTSSTTPSTTPTTTRKSINKKI